MKKLYSQVLLLLLLGSAGLHAQTVTSPNALIKSGHPDRLFSRKNSIQLELLGHGLFYSLNYERILLNYARFKTSVQIGGNFYPDATELGSPWWIPVTLNQLFSFRAHHIETGMGFVFTKGYDFATEQQKNFLNRKIHPYLAGKLGYRYQRTDGRMLYKVLFTPLMESHMGQIGFYPLGGITIGYSF